MTTEQKGTTVSRVLSTAVLGFFKRKKLKRDLFLESTSPSGDTIKVFVEDDLLSLCMISHDQSLLIAADNRPFDFTDEELPPEVDSCLRQNDGPSK